MHQSIRTPSAVGGEVAVLQLVSSEVLMAPGVVLFENCEGKAREAVHVHLIGGNPVAALTESL